MAGTCSPGPGMQCGLPRTSRPGWLGFSLTSRPALGRQMQQGPSGGWSCQSGGCKHCKRASCAGLWPGAGRSDSFPPQASRPSYRSPILRE